MGGANNFLVCQTDPPVIKCGNGKSTICRNNFIIFHLQGFSSQPCLIGRGYPLKNTGVNSSYLFQVRRSQLFCDLTCWLCLKWVVHPVDNHKIDEVQLVQHDFRHTKAQLQRAITIISLCSSPYFPI